MLKVRPDAKVYIICPANLATGGPQLLHQIAFKLRSMQIDSYLYYLPNDVENPRHPYYEQYDIPYVKELENSSDNIIIIPETDAKEIYNKKFSKMQRVIWWLSVDNYFTITNAIIKRHCHKKTFKLKQLINYYKIPMISYIAKRKEIFHLVQSDYARDFLKKNNIFNIAYLSDYLGQSFFSHAEILKEKPRNNVVLYNPKKGFEFTSEIIKNAPFIKFKAIEGFSPAEVANLLAESKVYIDFGTHPGKDRFPREAAIMGCCVLTNKKGSANFYQDVSINEEFKFDDASVNIPSIIAKITECFENFETESMKFESYRNKIKNEEQQFDDDLHHIFKQIK